MNLANFINVVIERLDNMDAKLDKLLADKKGESKDVRRKDNQGTSGSGRS